MTSLNFNLKHFSGEFVYLICDEDGLALVFGFFGLMRFFSSVGELVRLTGFGNAAGLMADKGLLGQGR